MKKISSSFLKLHFNFSYLNRKAFIPEEYGLDPNFKLTNFSEMKGWGCKVPQNKLLKYLERIGGGSIGKETPDCSVTPISRTKKSLISTIDFFYPLVEDPFIQGRIACCNVLSDLYAMGVTKIDTILMVLAVSLKMTEEEREVVTSLMFEGFNDAAVEAETTVTGGQSIMNPWPIIGGAAFSSVAQKEYIKPNNAQIGDVIILTKPLGTQIAVNVYQYYRNQNEKWGFVKDLTNPKELQYAYDLACKSMSTLNRKAAVLMRKYNAHCATDVTGFGILGHAKYLAQAQNQNVDFILSNLPVLKGMYQLDKTKARNFKFEEGYSAETSGGLFICLQKDKVSDFLKEFQAQGEKAYVVGEVVKGSKDAILKKNFSIEEI